MAADETLLARVRALHVNERNGYGPGDCHCDECCDTVDALRQADRLCAENERLKEDLNRRTWKHQESLEATDGG